MSFAYHHFTGSHSLSLGICLCLSFCLWVCRRTRQEMTRQFGCQHLHDNTRQDKTRHLHNTTQHNTTQHKAVLDKTTQQIQDNKTTTTHQDNKNPISEQPASHRSTRVRSSLMSRTHQDTMKTTRQQHASYRTTRVRSSLMSRRHQDNNNTHTQHTLTPPRPTAKSAFLGLFPPFCRHTRSKSTYVSYIILRA